MTYSTIDNSVWLSLYSAKGFDSLR